MADRTDTSELRESRYAPAAYNFLLLALRYTQEKLQRVLAEAEEETSAHISGQELCQGIREFAAEHFGMLTPLVFKHWGIQGTGDFGRMVFEMVEKEEMRKTEQDQLSDFDDVFDFRQAFDTEYQIDIRQAFRRPKLARK